VFENVPSFGKLVSEVTVGLYLTSKLMEYILLVVTPYRKRSHNSD
jgi:hypothetical protein